MTRLLFFRSSNSAFDFHLVNPGRNNHTGESLSSLSLTLVVGIAGSIVLAVMGSGCASALKEPPTAAQLAVKHRPSVDQVFSTTEILIEAERRMSQAPDTAAVEQALSLFLEACNRVEAPLHAFVGASRASAWLVEHVADKERRRTLATEGVQIAQLCRQRFPASTECRYRLALAVGQQARERPSTGDDGLKVMVELLEGLVDEQPLLDHAGPYRVLALVMLRAPGWPTGPGDPEFALELARTAVNLVPRYPPNYLVLGEAEAANDNVVAAGSAYRRAAQLADEAPVSGNREASEWIDQAREALADLP